MLIRLHLTCVLLAIGTVAATTSHSLGTVEAQPLTDCPADSPPFIDATANCNFGVTNPQIDSGPFYLELPAGAGGGSGCIREHGADNGSSPDILNANGPREIVCVHPRYGAYSRAWDCYLDKVDDPPTEGMHGYPDHAEDGVVHLAACFPPGRNPYDLQHWTTCDCGAQGEQAQWPRAPAMVVVPPSEDLDIDEGGPGLLELWVDALNNLEMHGPTIATAPPTASGLVRMPTWLWTEDTDQTWPDVLEAEAVGGPWLVEAWAEPQHIEWDMGDGLPPEQCGPGVAWTPGQDPHNPSAETCRHTYLRPSSTEPNGVFEILALTTWRVWWHINGQFDNEVEIQVGTTAAYQVNELQVLTGP